MGHRYQSKRNSDHRHLQVHRLVGHQRQVGLLLQSTHSPVHHKLICQKKQYDSVKRSSPRWEAVVIFSSPPAPQPEYTVKDASPEAFCWYLAAALSSRVRALAVKRVERRMSVENNMVRFAKPHSPTIAHLYNLFVDVYNHRVTT